MAAETGFLIDGTIHEVPALGSLTNGERRILYDYAAVVEEDFFPLDGETEEETETRSHGLMRHPGFWPGLMHIAYRRAHPGIKDAKIKQLIDDANFAEAMSTMGNTQEEDGEGDGPPAPTSEPTESSERSSLENENSPTPNTGPDGNGSTNGSGEADSLPSPTTASRSERSSRFDHSI